MGAEELTGPPIHLRRKKNNHHLWYPHEFLSQPGKQESFMSPAAMPIDICLLVSDTGCMVSIVAEASAKHMSRKRTILPSIYLDLIIVLAIRRSARQILSATT
jgi:hypothetical protein